MLAPTPDYVLPTAWEEHLSKRQLLRLFKKVNRAFYFHPKILWQTLLSIRSLPEALRIFLGGVSLLRMELLRVGKRRI